MAQNALVYSRLKKFISINNDFFIFQYFFWLTLLSKQSMIMLLMIVTSAKLFVVTNVFLNNARLVKYDIYIYFAELIKKPTQNI